MLSIICHNHRYRLITKKDGTRLLFVFLAHICQRLTAIGEHIVLPMGDTF